MYGARVAVNMWAIETPIRGDGQPCWMIVKWFPPEHYGSPETYYANTFDSSTKLYFVGEYPWEGRYEIIQPLISKEFIDGKLVIEHFPLTHYLIDVILPMMEAHQRLTLEEQQAAKQLAAQMEKKKEMEDVADKFNEALPTYINPVSYSKQGCRTSLLDRKCHAIQQVWNRMASKGQELNLKKGIQQGASPVN